MWSFLQPAEQRQDMNIGCSRLAMVAQDIYSRFGCGLVVAYLVDA
jgi:hypothetical protein